MRQQFGQVVEPGRDARAQRDLRTVRDERRCRRQGSAISLTADGVSTTGAFGKDCDITFSKHDAEGVTADFTCTNLPAVGSSSTQVYTINVKGNFTLTP